MRILVTAGNTQTPIDQVRCITNIFSGNTGALIAAVAQARKHEVTALTSNPDLVSEWGGVPGMGLRLREYQTFDDLQTAMTEELQTVDYDAIIHVAAVSDFYLAGAYAPDGHSQFDAESKTWRTDQENYATRMVDIGTGKIKSSHPELWLRLLPTPKLVDRIRTDWGFRGVLVKFKLEVGVTEEELTAIGRKSRLQSQADILVANTLEGKNDWAQIIRADDSVQRVNRQQMPSELLREVEAIHAARSG